MTGGPCWQHCGPAASFKLAHLSHSPLTLSSSCTSFTTVAEMHNCGMSYMHIPHISGRIVHICEGRCVNLFGEMRNCGLSWVHRCRGAEVQPGKQGNRWDAGGHTLPQLRTLKIFGWAWKRIRWEKWRRRFMQIDGWAGVGVAADVRVQAAPAPSTQHPTGCSTNPKSQMYRNWHPQSLNANPVSQIPTPWPKCPSNVAEMCIK